ncbi:MAG TPA: cysteine peptidase family C39 domain-containing protein [Kofleriaceae bacterium]|nr:cysteine peptidase family C39 domain-containing protein [Kofleriaceae bacterium]
MRIKPYLAPPYFPTPTGDPTARVLPIAGHFQVTPYTCGFASVLTVLRSYGRSVNERELYRRLVTGRDGTSEPAILDELHRTGIETEVRHDLGFGEIRRVVDQRRLIIGYHNGLDHWLVVHGYGTVPERVYVADSLVGNRRQHDWADYGPKLGGFGIICKRGGSIGRRLPEPGRQAA